MLDITDGYKHAIVGDVRRMFIKAVIDTSDPDMTFGSVRSSGETQFSKKEQLYDKNTELESKYATLEKNRWVLDGEFRIVPDDQSSLSGEIGFVGNEISGEDGKFDRAVYVDMAFSNVSILQACSVYFSQDYIDGVAEDFSVSVYSGDNEVYKKNFTGNNSTSVSLDGFTVYDPTSIRVTVTKWSLPGRRMRVAEIIPGIYESWTSDIIASLDIQMRGNFSCTSTPYGTCTLRMDNLNRRFEPRNKSGIFQSIEERQAIPVSIGCELENGTVEYKQAGVFYQSNGGWKTGDNAMTMQWDLVDIVGLLAGREFNAPSNMPSTLSGWMCALVSQLGENFVDKYHVDPDYAELGVYVNNVDDVEGKKCGDILRWVCMATGTWPRADANTGYLTAEPFWNQGNRLDLDNMTTYPVMKANDDIAVLTFKLFDGKGTTLNISGNATGSQNTLTVSNPFIHTEEQARTAARQILSNYGGIKLETTGRGDPAGEIGDVDILWLNESSATIGRRMEQSFSFSNGVLRDCKSVLLQASGSYLFENRALMTESGSFTVPSGVSELRVVLIGGGSGGSPGTDGSLDVWTANGIAGNEGAPGSGGKVWTGTISVNSGQVLNATIGGGGGEGMVGSETTFGNYSSENGQMYQHGFTDISSGDVFGRTGVQSPVHGSGDGGAGGAAGAPGYGYYETLKNSQGIEYQHLVIVNPGGPGGAGVPGASGAVVIYWDKAV